MLSTAGCRAVSCAYVYDRASVEQCGGGVVEAEGDPAGGEVAEATGDWTARLVEGADLFPPPLEQPATRSAEAATNAQTRKHFGSIIRSI
jgi:hypothetical protein